MKVLIVSFTFPPNKDGVANAAAAMVEGFLEKGWEVEVLTEATDPPRQSRDWKGARITECSYTRDGGLRLRLHDLAETYEEYLRRDWSHVIFHAYLEPLRIAIPLLDSVTASKILVSHGYGVLVWQPARKFPFGIGQVFKGFIASMKMTRWLPKFDRVVYLSPKADLLGFYDHFLAKCIRHPGIAVIPNGIDPAEHGRNPSGFRATHGIPGDAFMFLCVANYSPRKDQGFAARAFRRAAIPGSVLVFIGSSFNEHSDAFRRQDEQHTGGTAPGKIIWLEGQDRAATLDALAACDAFVLSARHEAQPIAILEAMREKKPWLARRAGCIELMEGGLCIDSVAEMADAMSRLSQDPTLREKLASSGLEAVYSRYNRDNYVTAYRNLLEESFHRSPHNQAG